MRLLCQVLILVVISQFSIPIMAQEPERVTYCARNDWLPFEGVRNSKHIGLIADYMSRISQLMPLRFQVVPVDSWQQALEFLSTGQCQMTAVMQNATVVRSNAALSQPFFDIPYVIVTRSTTPLLTGYSAINHRITGVVEGFHHSEYIARYYPQITIVTTPSEKEGLQQLAQEDIDVMIVSLFGANSYMRKHADGSLSIAGIAEPFDKLQFAVGNEQPDMLISTLNDAITTISQSKKVAMLHKWNKPVLYETNHIERYIFSGVIFLLISGGLFMRWRRASTINKAIAKDRREIDTLQSVLLDKNRTIEFLSNHDAESGLFNRNHMIQKAEEEIARFRRFHSSASLVVIDVMSLRKAEESLVSATDPGFARAMGKICMTTVREVDVVARWSNDQIVLLCPQTEQPDAHLLATRLIERIEQMAVEQGYRIKMAAGIASLRDNWSFNDWYEQACSVLHQARRNGGGVALLRYY